MKLPQAAQVLKRLMLLFSSALLLSASPVLAQISQVDPNDAIGTDSANPAATNLPSVESGGIQDGVATDPLPESNTNVDTATGAGPTYTSDPQTTFQKDDLIGAAEGVFGKGAAGLGGIIENILRKQGEPNGYIVGREGGGAFVLGLRYGSGTLKHKVEGEQPVYWTGPSVGFDAGANAGSTFVLVYNLYDTEDLYRRYPSGEGAAYLVGGFNASYLRRGDVVLIPIRLGVGVRLGANVGYMKFSKKQRWLPF
jgi:hypothetical protein